MSLVKPGYRDLPSPYILYTASTCSLNFVRGEGSAKALPDKRTSKFWLFRYVYKERFATKGTQLAEQEISHMSKQLESFKSFLEDFAAKHQSDIRKNQEFRQHFQKMCAKIGVDPLASSKGFWAEILGVGDFYYEVAVQITEACLATRSKNGGLIPLGELHKLVLKGRSKNRQDVSEDDILRSIKKLHILGEGFKVIPLHGIQLIQSVPGELNLDQTTILDSAQASGYTSVAKIVDELGWTKERAIQAFEYLIKEGMVWIDEQGGDEVLYWVPGLFLNSSNG